MTKKAPCSPNEVSELKARYAHLLEEFRKLGSKEEQYRKHTRDLIERVKELNCLYTISDLADKAQSYEAFLGETVQIVPAAMQYPEIACARITWDARKYESDSFCESPLSYGAQIVVGGENPGWIEVFYSVSGKVSRDSLFLKEEKKLIQEIALQLGNVIARFISARKLEIVREELVQKAGSLEEMNTALKVLLDHQKREKAAVEKSFLSNLNVLVLPYLEKMRQIASGREMKAYLEIVERNLIEITIPYVKYFSDVSFNFTPAEIQIAKMVLENYDTKQIAQILNVSESAVSFHRKNIRRKLGLSNQKANLNAHLQTLFRKE